MQVSSVDFGMGTEPILQRGETNNQHWENKTRALQMKSVDSEDNRKEDASKPVESLISPSSMTMKK